MKSDDMFNNKEMIKHHFPTYCKYVYPRYIFGEHLIKIMRALTDIDGGKSDRLILNLPPRCIDDEEEIVAVVDGKLDYYKHGDLNVGDYVYNNNGELVEITSVTNKTFGNQYKIFFNDDSSIICTGTHKWFISNKRRKFKEYTTDELFEIGVWSGERGKRGSRRNFKLPNRPIINYPERDLKLSPYFLGYWLGDGTTNKPVIVCDEKHTDGIDSIKEKYSSEWIHNGLIGRYYSNIINIMREYNLINNKHIPNIFLLSSVEQRLELLAGLIDSDGHINESDGRVGFTNTNYKLIKQVKKLVNSLGITTNKIKIEEPRLTSSGIQGRKKIYKLLFTTNINIPTRLPHKKVTVKKGRNLFINDIIKLDNDNSSNSITVNSKSSLYSVGDNIITHNSGKSLTVSQLFPSWYLTKNPDKRIIFATYESDFASSFGAKVRDNIKEHSELGIEIDNRSSRKDEFEIKNHLGGYKSSGVGSSITGRGANIAIVDDPIKNSEEAKSSVIKDKIVDWFDSTLTTRLEPDGAIIVIQTRWAIDDLTGYLLEEQPDEWKVLNFPALNENGESFFPERFSTENYLRIKKNMSDYWWNALYMNNPVSDGGMFFKPDCIKIVNRLGCKVVKKCRAWDIATYETLNKKSNYTVGSLLYLMDDKTIHIKNIARFRGTVGEVESKIHNIMSHDDNDVINVIEQQPGMAGITLKQHWNEYLKGFPIHWEYSNKDKESRALPFATAVESGIVSMSKASWNDDLVKELIRFNPNDDSFDDIVDSCSLGFNFLNRSRRSISMNLFNRVNRNSRNNIFNKLGMRG